TFSWNCEISLNNTKCWRIKKWRSITFRIKIPRAASSPRRLHSTKQAINIKNGYPSKKAYDRTTCDHHHHHWTFCRHTERTGRRGWRNYSCARNGNVSSLYSTPGTGHFLSGTYTSGGNPWHHSVLHRGKEYGSP